MTYKVLSRKWRPKKFDQVIGQNHITKVLQNAIKVNRISHSYLFSGPRGVGKTTIARILASKLNSVNDIRSSLDIIELICFTIYILFFKSNFLSQSISRVLLSQ